MVGSEALAARAETNRGAISSSTLYLLGLLAIAVFILGLTTEMRRQQIASGWIERSRDVLQQAVNLELHVQTAASEGRGFVISRDVADRVRLDTAAHQVREDIAGLRLLTADNPIQQAEIDKLEPIILGRLAILRNIMAGQVDGELGLDPSVPAFSAAVAMMDRITQGIDALRQEERRRLAEHKAVANHQHTIVFSGLAFGGALLFVSALLLIALLDIRRRNAKHVAELRQANLELNRRAQERTEHLRRLADELSSSEARQRRYLDHAPFAMKIMTRRADGQYAYDYMNLACQALVGRPTDHFIRRTLHEMWPEQIADDIAQRLTDCLCGETPVTEVVAWELDGAIRSFHCVFAPVEPQPGRLRQIQVCVREVTQDLELARQSLVQVEALRKSEDFLERIGQVAGVGGWEIDLVTHALHWSAETYHIHGLPPEAKPSVEETIAFYAPEARPVIREAMQRAASDGEGWDLELPFDTADGRRIMVRSVGSVVLADGKPIRVTGALQDVTDRMAERAALHAANERITLATDSGGIGIWDWDVASGRLVWCNWMHRLYDLPPGDGVLTVEMWSQRVHESDLKRVTRAVQDALAGRQPFDTEFRVVWGDGSVHDLRAKGQVTRDAAGRAVRMIGVNWDVTEQRRLAAELVRQAEHQAEAAERETALFRTSVDLQYIVSVVETVEEPSFIFETVSPACERVTGWRPEDVVGRRPQEFLPPDTAAAVLERFRLCLLRGTTLSWEETLSTPIGNRDYVGSITPIRHPATGQIVRLAGSLRDETERNRLQEAMHHAEKMSAIGRLAAGVAHDFNNILQSISGSLELVLDEVPRDTPEHMFLSTGLRSAVRGSDLTHRLLAFARKQLLRPRDIDLPALLSDIQVLLGRTLNPQVMVKVYCDSLVSRVRVDPGQLESALLNLAINASHAMPNGGRLTIDARLAHEDGTDWVVLTVADTGTGMDEETLAKAVEPFFSTKGQEGSGLGLSMVQGFVEQSGGKFHISSRLGIGTVIELKLPAAKPADSEVAEPNFPRLAENGCILLVDDDADVMLTTGAILEKAGFGVLRASDVNQAVAMIAEGVRIDAIVTDYAMPAMNGADLVAEARLHRPGLPAIIISGFTDINQTAAPGNGVVRLHKPFQRSALLDALRDLAGAADEKAEVQSA
jgi:PAS domain S-box-containing protein